MFQNKGERDLRILEDVHWDFIAILVESFLNIESPQQACNSQKSSLLSQPLTTADSSTPPKSHVTLLVRERTMERMIFEKPLGTESIWFGEIVLVSVNGPHVSLDPSVFGNVPSLLYHTQISTITFTTIFVVKLTL